jgi:hypothetical protein
VAQRIQAYKLVTGIPYTDDMIELKVNGMLEEGWVPLGELTVVPPTREGGRPTYVQAMGLPVDDED